MSRANACALLGGLILISTACAPGRAVVRGNWPDGRIEVPVSSRRSYVAPARSDAGAEGAVSGGVTEDWMAATGDAGNGMSAADLNRSGVLKAVYFSYDSADIAPSQLGVLEANVAWLTANPSARIIVEGHCDERGTREYNLALGQRRANAARDFLVSMGIAPSRIEVVSYGEELPAVIAHSEPGWSQNRRADFVIVATSLP